jgi:hypothetical protein
MDRERVFTPDFSTGYCIDVQSIFFVAQLSNSASSANGNLKSPGSWAESCPSNQYLISIPAGLRRICMGSIRQALDKTVPNGVLYMLYI